MSMLNGVEKWTNEKKQLHRENGPARITYFGNHGWVRGAKIEEWFINGIPYRENDKPAYVEYHEVAGKPVALEIWYKDGVIGREDDKPSFIEYFPSEPRRLKGQTWLANTEKKRENSDLPVSISYYDNPGNRVSVRAWDKSDKNLTEYMENARYYDVEGEDRIENEWWKRDSTEDRPQIVKRFDNRENRISEEIWVRNHTTSRTKDRPAKIRYFDTAAHGVSEEEWQYDGKPYRVGDRPTKVVYYQTETGRVVKREEWYKATDSWSNNHILHRATGPAVISYDINGEVLSTQWFIDGKESSEMQCSREMLRTEAPISRSGRCRKILRIKGKDSYFDGLIQLCDQMEETVVEPRYIADVVSRLKESFKTEKTISISTSSGKEVLSSIPNRWDLVAYIPQVTTGQGKIRVRYTDQPGIDYGGVSRQFISSLYQDIITTLFTKIDLDNETFFQNQEMFIARPRYAVDTRSDGEIRDRLRLPQSTSIDTVYELAGNLACYAILNELPFSISFSRHILRQMLGAGNSEIQNVVSYILDTGKILEMDYDRYMKYAVEAGIVTDVDDQDPEETQPNASKKRKLNEDLERNREEEKDRQVMIHLTETLRDNSRRIFENPVAVERLEAFLRGFSPVGQVLMYYRVTIDELDKLLYQDRIAREDMEYLLERTAFEDFTPRAKDLVKNAVLNIGDYRQLLKWWSGSPYIIPEQKYTIKLTDYYTVLDDGSRIKTNFNAHTCFFSFDVDKDIVESSGFLTEFMNEIRNVRTTTV
jgi:hypothetical protein